MYEIWTPDTTQSKSSFTSISSTQLKSQWNSCKLTIQKDLQASFQFKFTSVFFNEYSWQKKSFYLQWDTAEYIQLSFFFAISWYRKIYFHLFFLACTLIILRIKKFSLNDFWTFFSHNKLWALVGVSNFLCKAMGCRIGWKLFIFW